MNRLFLAIVAILISSVARGQTASPQLRDLNAHCPFTPPQSPDDWMSRADDLRLQINVSLGLHPEILLPDVQPDVYGLVQREGYVIQRITFDSLPGLKVTGNLYLPDPMPKDARIPGILCPHGHWNGARFRIAPISEQEEALATGGERFRNAAAHHIQARCVQLARMGCGVLHWDMIGYCDSQQISQQRAHGFANQPRDIEVTPEGWLLFSPLAEGNLQSILGLQALATKRAIDALLTMEFIDPNRIAITGASGGGTQSFLGAVTDERIKVAFPAVMVSTGMQGGCTCENAALLRVGTNNAEIAALIAPRPLGMTAADDWTATMPIDGFPEIQSVYQLLGAPKNVALFPSLHFGHNFNHVSRVSMYGWMNEHLHLGFRTPVLESDFQPALADELTVWDDNHPKPNGGLEFERSLMKRWAELSSSSVQANSDSIADGWRVCLGLTAYPTIESEHTTASNELAFTSAEFGSWHVSRQATASSGIQLRLIGEQGDTTLGFESLGAAPQPLVDSPRLAAAYTFGYNLPLFARHARQLAATLKACHLGKVAGEIQEIEVIASGVDAAVAMAAIFCLQQSGATDSTITRKLKLDGFRFAGADSIRAPSFLPGAVKYGDAPALEKLVSGQ